MRLSDYGLRTLLTCCAMTGVLLLSACQSTINRMNDCRSGDWQLIGNKDGKDGLDRNFEERRRFCASVDADKIRAESAGLYETGWVAGNQQFWYKLGRDDGRKAYPVTQYLVQSTSATIRDQHTPLNQPSYEQGWQQGINEYWFDTGMNDGKAGRNASEEKVHATNVGSAGFRADAYRQGWSEGNYSYWENLGYQDAHVGIPDSTLTSHAAAAKSRELLVREDAYHNGWNREIVEYWKQLGWNDAVSGRDIQLRRDDARRRGLKIMEAEYQQQWQRRLMQYWEEAGTADGYGQPFQLEQRMNNARNDQVFVIPQTRDIYTQAWNRQNAAYCTVDNAFNWARQNQRMAIEVCPVSLQFRLQQALMSGRDYEDISHRSRALHRELGEHQDRYRDTEQRLNRLEAEIRRNQDDKNRPNNQDNVNTDRRNERDRNELRDQLQSLRRRIDDMRSRESRYEQQLQQIKRDLRF